MDEKKIRRYTRIPVPFPVTSPIGAELAQRGLLAWDWPWWMRDDGRIVAREFLSASLTLVALENEDG